MVIPKTKKSVVPERETEKEGISTGSLKANRMKISIKPTAFWVTAER